MAVTTAICKLYASSPTGHIGENKIYYGASYYPEAWPEENIDDDIALMKEMGVNVVRMAEFAWAKMEPEEGKYNFKWLHDVIDKLYANGIEVILGTPTATPPAWLAAKHPEMYRVTENGVRLHHGGRRDCSYTSDVYRSYSKGICEAMAREFGHKPGVIAWQTDNEMTLTPDYSEETKSKWTEWLKKRYGTPENLNRLWNLNLWSQAVSDFDHVPMPTQDVTQHISLWYAWREFTNRQLIDFNNMQIEAIRQYSDLPVTHDGMPGQSVDYERLFAPMDFGAINTYHSFEAYDLIQSNYDRMRGLGKGYHWLFETAPNNSGGGLGGNTWYLHQIPGSLQAALWMNYASGGQGAMYWPWRQQWAGQEVPHGAVISAWGKKVANWDELAQLGDELNKASDFLMANPVARAEAAIVFSHSALNGLQLESIANGLRYYQDWTYRFYRPMADNYIFRDVIYPGTDFSQYKLLFMPLLPYLPEDTKSRLREWVENGGILLFGPMSGYRTEEWTQHTDAHAGNLEEWMGVEVESFIPIGMARREKEIPFLLEFDPALETENAEASLWSLALAEGKGRPLAFYTSGHHAGKPAIAESKVGKGKVVFLGTDPGKDAMGKLLTKYASEAGIRPEITGDKGVVAVPREGVSEGLILVNIFPEKKRIGFENKDTKYRDILNGKIINASEQLELEPFEYRVFEKIK